jgi:hypothetical protein
MIDTARTSAYAYEFLRLILFSEWDHLVSVHEDYVRFMSIILLDVRGLMCSFYLVGFPVTNHK